MTHKLTSETSLNFILGGHSIFTILKTETGGRFTYRVTVPEDQKDHPTIWFVSVLTGTDNTSDYSYIGYIRAQNEGNHSFYHGAKSKVSKTAPSVVVFAAIFGYISAKGIVPKGIEVFHEGKCGRCGRALTVPESIESGFGPECVKKVGKTFGSLAAIF